jgi:tetratricopeptide (TPR) repeat protein
MLRDAHALKKAVKQHRSGNLRQAVAGYQQIIRRQPNSAEAHNNLGVALKEQGRLDDAVARYQEAIRLQPKYAEAHNNLANALLSQGKIEEAIACLEQAIGLKPDYAEAHTNLANVFTQQNKLEEAIGCYRQALRINPECWEACINLGNVLDRQDKVDEAIECYRQAVRLKVDSAEAYNNLGAALMRQDQRDQAVHCYLQALRHKPDYADVYSNLSIALREQGRLDDASTCAQHALRLNSGHLEAKNNLGSVLMELGRLEESLACFEQVLCQNPGHVEAHFNRALLWLLQGNWAQGWPEYEWRWQAKASLLSSYQQPRWDGSHLKGRKLLLVAEQGLGDTLQFIRYAPLLKERGASIIVCCQKALLRILKNMPGIDALVPEGAALPAFDVYAPLMSLPGILQTTPDTVPANVPYLSADADLCEQWRRELSLLDGFKIGIAWQGNPTYKRDRCRSIPFSHLESLSRLPGVRLLSLQKGLGDLGSRIDEIAGPFMDTAAIMQNLDLVITSDTAIAHLAGALGVPVWLALSYSPDWRWLLDRQDSPWYPSMRMFRQARPGDWQELFQRVEAELVKLLAITH